MNQKRLVTATLGILSAPVFALGNAGFESGNATQWKLMASNVGSTLTARKQVTVNILDQADPSFSYSTGVVPPVSGTWLGRLQLANSSTITPGLKHASATYRFSANAQPTTTNDVLYVRLLSADYLYPTFKDWVQISYVGTQGKFIDILEDDDFFGASAPDTGWVPYAVPTGTKYINVKVVNAYNRFASNTPVVLLDYAEGTAPLVPFGRVGVVPEPAGVVLMLAGLVAVGFAARRRRGA